MESEPVVHWPIPQIKLFDEIVLPPGSLYRSICTIGVVVTSVPSKHLWRVRVPYGAPIVKLKPVDPTGRTVIAGFICRYSIVVVFLLAMQTARVRIPLLAPFWLKNF